MKKLQLISSVQEFLGQRNRTFTSFQIKPNGRIYITITDKKGGRSLVAQVMGIVQTHDLDRPF